MTRPVDFDPYWGEVEAALAGTPTASEEDRLAIRSTAEAECFTVRLTGAGPYRLFGYLGVPRCLSGPAPAMFLVPRLQSVVEVLTQGDPQARRGRFVTFSLAMRGQRNSDRPYAARFPGLLTDGVTCARSYPLRWMMADVLRGFDYLLSRPEVDRKRVLAVGTNDLALLLAGMRPQVTHLVTTVGPFHRWREAATATDEYPLEEFNDYLRSHPEAAGAMADTLAYFDPSHVADRARCRALLWAGPVGSPLEPAELRALDPEGDGRVEIRATERSRYLDGTVQEDWIQRELGFPAPLYPEAWR
jgi:cephalosporin-C deacetylase